MQIERNRSRGEMVYGTRFEALPVDCIAAIITLTSIHDACRFACVCWTFRSAADSDSVWDKFLPSDYRDILARSNDGQSLLDSLSKKQLFFYFADNSLFIDGRLMSFALEKSTGNKCYTIAARKLDLIAWGAAPWDDWRWQRARDSRFLEVAEFVYTWWIEIRGRIRASMLSPNTTYAAYLVYKFTRRAHGFNIPVEVEIRTPEGNYVTGNVCLDILNEVELANYEGYYAGMEADIIADVRFPKLNRDGWLEVEIGEFWTMDEEGDVELLLLEGKSARSKVGLIIEGIEIRPTTCL